MVRYAGLTRGQSHGQPGGEGMTKQRLTKQQAGEHFGVSVTTLDRMIRRGDLAEPQIDARRRTLPRPRSRAAANGRSNLPKLRMK